MSNSNKQKELIDKYLLKGKFYLDNKEYEKALKNFNKVIEIDPNNKMAYNNKGYLYEELKNYKKALENFNKVIEIDPNAKETYNARGCINVYLKKYKEALEDYNREIKLNPDFIDVYYNRGRLYFTNLKNNDKALKDFNKVIQLDSNYKEVYNSRAILYTKLGKNKEALEDYNKGIELDPNCKVFYFNRGSLYIELNEYKKALEDFNKVIKIDSNNKEAYCNRGYLYTELKQYKKALENFTKAIEINKDYKRAYNSRGIFYNILADNEVPSLKQLEYYTKAIEDFKKAKGKNATINKKITELKLVANKNDYSEKEIKNLKDSKIYIEKIDYNLIFDELKNKNLEKELSYYIGKILINELKEVLKKNQIDLKIFENLKKMKCFYSAEILGKISNLLDQYPTHKMKIIEIIQTDFLENLKNNYSLFNKNEQLNIDSIFMYKSINKRTLEAIIKKGILKSKAEYFNDVFDPFYKKFYPKMSEILSNIRFSCFSNKNNNLLLWAHYGDNHRGICLKYKLPKEMEKNVFLDKIIYSGIKIKKIIPTKEDDSRQHETITLEEKGLTIYDAFLRKHKDWQYEEELRMIYINENDDELYTNIILEAIYFGIECPDNDINTVKELCKGIGLNIKFYKMEATEDLELKEKLI